VSVLSIAEARSAGVGGEDATIQLAIDDVESEIVSRFGPYANTDPVFELLTVPRGQTNLVLRRKAYSIVSIVEWETSNVVGGSSVTLDPTDYRIVGGYQVERLATGLNGRSYWLPWSVEVTYLPIDDTARRKMATIDVLRLEVGGAGSGSGGVSGLTSRRIGDYSESFGSSSSTGGSSTPADRNAILRRLGKAIVFA
jgi:hypothetical protein